MAHVRNVVIDGHTFRYTVNAPKELSGVVVEITDTKRVRCQHDPEHYREYHLSPAYIWAFERALYIYDYVAWVGKVEEFFDGDLVKWAESVLINFDDIYDNPCMDLCMIEFYKDLILEYNIDYYADFLDKAINILEAYVKSRKIEYDNKAKNNNGKRKTRTGFVYLLKHDSDYKIGVTNDLNRRVTQISPVMPRDIETVCAIKTEDIYSLEKSLHEKYSDYRLSGEWFELPPEAVQEFLDMANVPEEQLP